MKQHFLKTLEYEKWANGLMLDHLLSLDNLPEKAISIYSHLFAAQSIWYSRITNQENPYGVWDVIPTEQWKATSEELYTKLYTFISSCSEGNFGKTIQYQDTKGSPYKNVLEEILTHLFLHGSYHRGQLNLITKEFADSLPQTDYIFYVRKTN